MNAISCLLVENSDEKIQEILSAVFLAPKFPPQLERLFLNGFCIYGKMKLTEEEDHPAWVYKTKV